MASEAFTLDTGELLRVVDELARCQTRLHDLAAEVERRVRDLHGAWSGEAAAAQQRAQREWERGFRDVREALAELRVAADTAHANYTTAATTNTRLWDQLG